MSDHSSQQAAPNVGAASPRSDRGPWHIVSRVSGKHIGPFSTELDCSLARAIATPDWATGIDMDRDAFDRHLAAGR